VQFQTLTGFSQEKVYEILAAPLPPDCYTSVPGGARLTDIDPATRDVVMNRLFGPCGVGWRVEYNQLGVTEVERSSGSKAYTVSIPNLRLYVRWQSEDGELFWSSPIPCGGSSTNNELGYATKGALTSAISGALSRLGWQQLVYQGKMNHTNADKAYNKYGPHPFEREIVSAGLTPK
jgi:hypothetical protein